MSAAAIAAVGSANAEAQNAGAAAAETESVPKELKDLRRRLNYLKNIYDIKESVRAMLHPRCLS